MRERQRNLIRPIIQSGKVVSSTHYFLLAPKPDANRANPPPLASVKPFSSRADNSQSGKSTFYVGKLILGQVRSVGISLGMIITRYVVSSLGYENNLEPEYQNQDEIDRVRPAPARPAEPKRHVPEALLINTTSEMPEDRSPSMSPRAQVQSVNLQVGLITFE